MPDLTPNQAAVLATIRTHGGARLDPTGPTTTTVRQLARLGLVTINAGVARPA